MATTAGGASASTTDPAAAAAVVGGALAASGDTSGSGSGGYIKTTSQSYVSREATIVDASRVELKGRVVVEPGVVLDGSAGAGAAADGGGGGGADARRGAAAISIRVGRYCYLDRGTTIRPSEMATGGGAAAAAATKCVPITIGTNTYVGRNCRIRAAAVGSFCHVGNGVTLGKRVIVKDCCYVGDGVAIGDDTVVPPFTRITSSPAYPAKATTSGKDQSASARGDGDAENNQDSDNNNVDTIGDGYRWSYPRYSTELLPPSTPTFLQERSVERYRAFAMARQEEEQQQHQ